MTVLEAVRMNTQRYMRGNKLESEIKEIKRDSARFCVAVFDFDWNELGKCNNTDEAASVYEVSKELVCKSLHHGGRIIVSGLRFRSMARR